MLPLIPALAALAVQQGPALIRGISSLFGGSDAANKVADMVEQVSGIGLTAAQLTARDINADGQLTGTELTGLNQWADQNENGHLDAGELTAAATAIKNTDYAFHTAGNGQPGAGVAATPAVNVAAPVLSTPASNPM